MSSGTSCGVSNTSTPAGWPYSQRRSANHCRRAPAASCRSAGVAGRVTANAMPSVTSPRVAASGHKACTVWAPARATRQPSRLTSRPARGGIFQPRSRSVTPRVHRPVRTMWQRTGTGVTSRPPPSANRLSAVATSCHAASQSMDSAGRPQGTRPSPAVDPWRARVPAKPAIPAATTGSRRRHDAARPHHPCMSRPAQHLDLATDAQTGKRRWHSDRRIGAHLHQPGLAQPIVAQGLARGGRGSAASHLRDAAQGHAIAHVVQDMACPRAVMAALRLELPSCMAASCARPRPSAACSNNVSKDSNSTDSIKACPRCAASGRHTSLMACPPGLPPQARQQPAGPANTGGTRWQARLAHPGSATAGRNRSAPCWTP